MVETRLVQVVLVFLPAEWVLGHLETIVPDKLIRREGVDLAEGRERPRTESKEMPDIYITRASGFIQAALAILQAINLEKNIFVNGRACLWSLSSASISSPEGAIDELFLRVAARVRLHPSGLAGPRFLRRSLLQ